MSMIDEVIQFWFGELDEEGRATEEKTAQWFKKDLDFDEEIHTKFAQVHAEIAAGAHEGWLDTAVGLLAYVIVLDQFSRNMYRDTGGMYATDEQALRVALKGIERGDDRVVTRAQRAFLYMPLMHSEEVEMQRRCVELFAAWRDEAEGDERESAARGLHYANMHLEIVERFGRFPHRNEILGRPSTPEEVEFLETPGSSF
jgi:uncharacterized protein (DUF924 family)